MLMQRGVAPTLTQQLHRLLITCVGSRCAQCCLEKHVMSPVRTCWVQMCTLLSTDMHSICLFNLCWKQMCAMLSKETCYVACRAPVQCRCVLSCLHKHVISPVRTCWKQMFELLFVDTHTHSIACRAPVESEYAHYCLQAITSLIALDTCLLSFFLKQIMSKRKVSIMSPLFSWVRADKLLKS